MDDQPTTPEERRARIHADINAERIRQDFLWGGATHDATHSANDWIAYIVRCLGKAQHEAELDLVTPPVGASEYRKRMVQVAALAVAAIEALERHHG